jgi:hypothetical protein
LTDSQGNRCGYNNSGNSSSVDNTNKTALYFIDPISLTTSVCLTSCPSSAAVATYASAICLAGVTATLSNYATLVSNYTCAAYNYTSSATLGVCIPDISTITSSMIAASASAGNSSVSASNLMSAAVSTPIQLMADLSQTWPVLIGAAVGALILSFLWLFIIQWFGAVFVWITILAFNVVGIAGAIWLYFYWQSAITKAGSSALTTSNYEVTAAFSAFIAVSCLAGIFLIITIALLKKIQIAVEIIKEATKAVRAMPLIGKFKNIIFSVFPYLDLACSCVGYSLLCCNHDSPFDS